MDMTSHTINLLVAVVAQLERFENFFLRLLLRGVSKSSSFFLVGNMQKALQESLYSNFSAGKVKVIVLKTSSLVNSRTSF